uniref:pH-response regulator protein palI/RIM9 n=1 Tax=Lygus hesperus TaxID=30085 RepID=A0A0A9WXV6_LYGHE
MVLRKALLSHLLHCASTYTLATLVKLATSAGVVEEGEINDSDSLLLLFSQACDRLCVVLDAKQGCYETLARHARMHIVLAALRLLTMRDVVSAAVMKCVATHTTEFVKAYTNRIKLSTFTYSQKQQKPIVVKEEGEEGAYPPQQ